MSALALPERAPGGLALEWARLVLGGLASAGVRELVISPGSRSTPFVLAAGEEPGLRLHDVIDERVAGFFALGLARASGAPVALLCTSGTAGAHYYPAVIEAAAAGIPLVVLTADRPPELHACAASQTIDQTRLFGAHVRAFHDLGAPEPAAFAAARRSAVQAVHAARWPVPGPVHLNVPARKPLEPPAVAGAAEVALAAAARSVAAAPLLAFAPRLAPDDAAIDALVHACRSARRGVIVAGPGPLSQRAAAGAVFALAGATGFPLLAEATSQLRFGGPSIAHFDLIARDAALRDSDLVLQLGAPPVTSALADLGGARWVIAEHGWNDPTSRASLVFGALHDVCAAVAARLPAREPSPWLAQWQRADAAAARAVDATLAAHGWSEGEVVRRTVAALADDELVMLGNSLPVREIDTFCAPAATRAGVLAQRGAAGIDGLIAGAAGAAASGRAVTLILGDVSFLHDVGGLAVCRERPLRIVVLHNDGGRIFEQLPIASAAGGALEHWTTPHGRELAPAAALYGLAHVRVGDAAALSAALARPAPIVIEARVPPHGAAAVQRALLEATR